MWVGPALIKQFHNLHLTSPSDVLCSLRLKFIREQFIFLNSYESDLGSTSWEFNQICTN